MPKWVADQKKKDKEKKAGSTSSQSSSVNQRASNSTFMGGGASVKKTEERVSGPSERKLEQIRDRRSSNTTSSRTTAAQRQKMGMPTQQDLEAGKEHRQKLRTSVSTAVKSAMSEDNQGFMQRQKSGTQTESDKRRTEQMSQRRTEVARNTGAAATKAVKDSATGYAKTLYDVTEMTAGNRNGTQALGMKMGIQDNKQRMRDLEEQRKKTVEEARNRRLKLGEAQDKRQAEWDERTKNAKGLEKAWYGAVESGTGMAADTLIGAATGTGQFGALASMGLRTYGTTRGQAEKEGATESEDRLYSLAQAGKEVGTELMFQGAGLAKKAYGGAGLSLADKAANVLTRGLTGKKADIVGAGVRLFGGTLEENAEEIAGWGLDPIIKEVTYGKKVRERAKESLLAGLPEIGSAADADKVASYFSTNKFTDDLMKEYRSSGLSEDEAQDLANEMRDMYVAYYSNDQETVDRLSDDIAAKISGQSKLGKDSWSLEELGDTLASTTLLTMATGAPGAVTTSVRGNAIFDSDEVKERFGEDAVRKIADAVQNVSDEEMSIKAKSMIDRLDSGKDLTGTQKFDLYQGYLGKLQETAKKARASEGMTRRAMEEQNLVPTQGIDAEGNRVYAQETQRAYNEKYASAELTTEAFKDYMESDNSISDDEARRTDAVKKAVADLHVGGLTVGDAHEFAYGNTLAREVLLSEEGIDLNDYVVRNKDGSVNYAATNEATENALFTINADNAIRSAQAETAVFIDNTRGEIDTDIMSRLGNSGQAVWKSINKDLDPRNLSEYLTTANAASYFYSAGRNTDVDMNTFIAENGQTGAFRNVPTNVLRRAFAAGSRDRIIANTPMYGQTVEAGSNIRMKNTKPIITGQLIVDKDVVLPDSAQSAYLALAMSTNTNVHIVGSLQSSTGAEVNGMSKGNDIYLNVNAAAEQNVGYVLMHEMTHQIKQYAPNEYLALENLVRDKWFNKDAKGMQKAIKDRIDLYSTKGGQQLTEEEAVEEIIADAMAEAMDDPNFAAEVCEESIELGNAILNSIKAALRSIRQMFASREFRNDRFHNSLLSYLGILDEAEKMWINALHTARQNKANGLIADWQDKANKQNQERLSISETVEQNIMDWYDSTTDEERRKEGGFIPIGTTPDVYKPLGIKETRLRIGKSKIQKILDDHPEMDINKIVDTIKGLETPMIVLQSRTQKNSIVVYGEVYTDDGKPIMASVKFNRVSADIEDLKYGVVTSAYARNDNQYQLDNARVLYVNPNKEKTDSWLSSLRLQLPSDITNFGYINKLAYYEDLVKPEANGETAMARAIREANERKNQGKFSISAPVERVKDLIAVHNLKPEDIRNTFELGGFPMPSIAVTKDSMGHDMYGDITLMFHSDTIDPQKRRVNEVFGGDAYTPVFPRIHYKANAKVAEKLSNLYYKWAREFGYDTVRPFYAYGNTLDDELDHIGGEAELKDRAKSDTALMRMFLRINGKDVEDVIKTTEITMPEGEVDLSKRLINALGEDAVRSIVPEDITGPRILEHRRQWVADHKEQLEAVYRDYFAAGGLSEEDINDVIPAIKVGEYAVAARKALNYLNDGPTTTREETDINATFDAVKKAAAENGYDEWIDDLFTGVEEKRGLRNDKDMFTPSGNRRKWESLYEPVTLEGVVRVMSRELSAGANGLLGANPKGASQKQYRSLDEIRADEDRLQMLPEEEYKKLDEESLDKFTAVCSSIFEHNADKFRNTFGGTLDIGEAIAETLNKTRTKDGIRKALTKEFGWTVTEAEMSNLMDAIDAIANVPTGYFEAKPRRAVGFDEVKAAIIPQNTDADIKTGLSERGIATYEYDPDAEGDRTEKVNVAATEQDIRFSITVDEKKHPTVKLNKRDYAIVRKAVFAKNARIGNESEHLIDYTFTDNDYVMYETWGDDSFRPFTKFPIEGNEDEIKEIRNVIKQDKGDIDPIIESVRNRRRRNRRGSSNAQEGRASASDDRLDRQEPGSGEISNTISSSGDIERYSIVETDANGSVLTEAQSDYFAYSAARDALGRLIPVYHGTQNGGFTIFDSRYGISSRYFFFVDSLSAAKGYSGSEEMFSESVAGEEDMRLNYHVYLNMVNPLIIDAQGNSWAHIPYEDDFVTTNWLAEFAEGEGYDGVIVKNVIDRGSADTEYAPQTDYIVFSSNQIKDVNNLNPTENPDIRYSITEDEAMSHMAHDYAYDNSYEALEEYEAIIAAALSEEEAYSEASKYVAENVDKFYAGLTRYADGMKFDDPILEEGRIRMARSKQDYFNSNKAKWNQNWLTDGEVLDINSVKKAVRDLVTGTMLNSNTKRKYSQETVNKTLIDMRLAYFYAKQGRTDIADALLWHSAHRMIDGVEFFADDGTYEDYKGLRDYLKTARIQLGEEYWSDADYGAFRKANFGRINLVQGNTNVDQIYQELEELFPGLFDSEEYTTPPDQLMHIADVLDSIQPYAEAYSSEYCAEWATDIASDLLDIMQSGKELKSTADKYKERYDEKAKAMKARHAEAMMRVRQQRDKAVRAEKVKLKEYVERQREKTLHRKWFDRINKSFSTLKDRLLTNTADSNIPEQYKKELARLLSAFDLQTIGSKRVEARRGVPGKNTLKMADVRIALKNIENTVDEFNINDSITDIIDELLGEDTGNGHNRSIEGLTIDELNASELERIAKLLEALVHEFNTYKTVKIAAKRQQTADIGHAQNDSSLEHAAKFGPGKDFNNGLLDWFDRVINLDEMTAAYMFRRIDPNNVGLGLMFKELRRSFDKYVRNTNQLKDWMNEILGEYQNRGRGPKKYGADEIEKWRSDNYAETIQLESGHTIRVSPAQMMSIYCLSNRTQAMSHMLKGGIVVAPNSFNGQIMSDLKKKANTALPEVLTETDIKNIKARLTPDQVKVAQKLQKLMAEKMAAWGNEASMNVIGIELFGEPDYFPIRSDKAGLISDLDENQFVEAIRNFGFTKAVKPGAGNPIMVEDIFKVVAEHCNNMNLYNAYSESINDFMKVYNYKEEREEGKYTVKQAIAHAYSQKATTFIMQFMKDLNGNVSGANTGLSRIYNGLLSRAKKASVFANGRVAAQQPTAISRAFYLIDPKYLEGVVTNEKATQSAMQEMFDHCPIALWKSWGYYDIQMGRTVEDVMMNNGNWLDDVATDVYGALDNVTWAAIWQMVKAETKDKNPGIKVGSEEFFELCNERMSEIVDLTQVVDSPIHRSHGMRAKGFLEKTATAFMSEPTLTFNMVKDGLIRTIEAWLSGNKASAAKIFGRTMGVFGLQAAMVGASAAIWDALRGKHPDGDDDEDDSKFHLWWLNTIANFKDELKLWNKVYFIKDIGSLFQGYGINNLALQGWKGIADGWAQLTGSRRVYSSKTWYENLFGGIGYLTGVPIKTLMTDLKAVYKWAGLDWDLVNSFGEYLDATQDKFTEMFGKEEEESVASSFLSIFDGKKNASDENVVSETTSEMKSKKEKKAEKENNDAKLEEYRESLSDNYSDEQKDKLVKQYKKKLESEESTEVSEDFDVKAHIQEGITNFEFEMEKRSLKAAENAAGKTGNAKNNALWDVIAEGYTKSVASGNMATINAMREAFVENGGDADWFDAKIVDKMKSEYKKTIYNDGEITPGASLRQETMRNYMTEHGVSEDEISEIVRKSYVASDLKAAMRIGNEEYIIDELVPLIRAGLTRADYEYLYKYRNYGAKSYDGKYTDSKYAMSTGTFIWPADGVITSHFGYRNAPTAGASSNHPAIDIGAPMGANVIAADGGVVIYAGTNGGYGNSVGIKHDNGMVTYYNHLSAWNVNVGDRVMQGQQIANVGSTGISTGPHLDFKIMNTDGEPVDPEKYLAAR